MSTTFIGANIRGAQGGMPLSSYKSDLTNLSKRGHILVTQEFQNISQWEAAAAVLAPTWDSFPSISESRKSATAAIYGGQAIFWLRSKFDVVDTFVTEAFRVAEPNLGTMADRWIRAVLLRDKATGFTAWYLSTHFVVNGDMLNSPAANRRFLVEQNLPFFRAALQHLKATGYPIMGEIDANIRPNSPDVKTLMKIFTDVGAVLHGELGIEYAFSIDNALGKFGKVTPTVVLPKSKPGGLLFTDHEARLLTATGTPVKKTDAELVAVIGKTLQNADAIMAASRAEGIPLTTACALVEQESGGANVYGHDVGGIFSTASGPVTVAGETHAQGSDVPVTPANFGLFLLALGAGGKTNGVGPMQITYAPYFKIMLEAGLLPWLAVDNMRYGFRIMVGNLKATSSDLTQAAARYNGGTKPNAAALGYGADVAAKAAAWATRLR